MKKVLSLIFMIPLTFIFGVCIAICSAAILITFSPIIGIASTQEYIRSLIEKNRE